MNQDTVADIRTSVVNYSKFFGVEWSTFLAPFLTSREYTLIGTRLTTLKKQGVNITPAFPNIFRAFKECPLYKLHTIIIAPDVYSGKTDEGELMADGLAFSAKNSHECPRTLDMIFEAIDQSVYDGEYVATSVFDHGRNEATWDLVEWAKQGILLLNKSLTTVVGEPCSHTKLWHLLMEAIIAYITDKKDALGIILIGDHAEETRKLIMNPTSFVVDCEHPETARVMGKRWDHKDVFKRLTDFHKNNNNISIKW